MKVTRRQAIVGRQKAAIATLRSVGWSRHQWVNELESALGEAFLIWCQARLARRNGQRRHARAWAAEFERLVSRKMVEIHVHPVKRPFDRRAAFEEAIAEMPDTIRALRQHVEREFGKIVGPVRRGIVDRDIGEFWREVREAARVVTG